MMGETYTDLYNADDFFKAKKFRKPLFTFKNKGQTYARIMKDYVIIDEARLMCDRYTDVILKELVPYTLYLKEELSKYTDIDVDLPQLFEEYSHLKDINRLIDSDPFSSSPSSSLSLARKTLKNAVTLSRKVSQSEDRIRSDQALLRERLSKSRDFHLSRIRLFMDAVLSERPEYRKMFDSFCSMADVDIESIIHQTDRKIIQTHQGYQEALKFKKLFLEYH